MRRVQMLRKKGYAAARIAQLMDLDEKEVRRMLKTEVSAWATRQKARAMTDDELRDARMAAARLRVIEEHRRFKDEEARLIEVAKRQAFQGWLLDRDAS